jgi:8-oxo-dGTP diphosphatase
VKEINVVAAIIVNDGKVFAAQRNGKGEVGFKWEFPGGKIEQGETPQEALARELNEELGISVKVGDFLMTVMHSYQTFRLTMHCYIVTISSGDIELREHIDSRWIGASEIHSVDWAAADLPVIEKVKEQLL